VEEIDRAASNFLDEKSGAYAIGVADRLAVGLRSREHACCCPFRSLDGSKRVRRRDRAPGSRARASKIEV